MASSSPPLTRIPVLLLKTKSHPTDAYEQYFSQQSSTGPVFEPSFVPVLEHTLNEANVSHLADLVRSGEIREEYGGVIFTSQRAVEAWIEVGKRVDEGRRGNTESRDSGMVCPLFAARVDDAMFMEEVTELLTSQS